MQVPYKIKSVYIIILFLNRMLLKTVGMEIISVRRRFEIFSASHT